MLQDKSVVFKASSMIRYCGEGSLARWSDAYVNLLLRLYTCSTILANRKLL